MSCRVKMCRSVACNRQFPFLRQGVSASGGCRRLRLFMGWKRCRRRVIAVFCDKVFVIRRLCRCVVTALWCVCKQGFFWMKRSLVWSVKKPCLRCKEALFENGGNKRCFRGLQWVSHRGGVVKTGVSRSYRKLIRLWRMEGNGHYH